MDDIGDIVDLDRYPLHRPNSAAMRELMRVGQQALRESSLFCLEGFVRPDRIPRMAEELESRVPEAARYQNQRLAYYSGDASLPANHPRNRLHKCSYHQVLNYQIPNDSALRQIFYWPPLTAFLGELCGYETFYRSECPHLALTAKIAAEGDTDGWHFDGNDVVFSLLLQAAESGGEFEYAPNVRHPDDERYDAVAAVLDDPGNNALRPPMAVVIFLSGRK